MKRVKGKQGIGVVTREQGIRDQTLRNWVKAVDAGKLNGLETKVVTPEQIELSRMWTENAPGCGERTKF